MKIYTLSGYNLSGAMKYHWGSMVTLEGEEAGNTYPFQSGLGAAAHPDGARLEVRGSRLGVKGAF